jgi:hypothetical protein
MYADVPFFIDDNEQLVARYDGEQIIDVRSTADVSLAAGELCALFGVSDEASAIDRARDLTRHALRNGEVL